MVTFAVRTLEDDDSPPLDAVNGYTVPVPESLIVVPTDWIAVGINVTPVAPESTWMPMLVPPPPSRLLLNDPPNMVNFETDPPTRRPMLEYSTRGPNSSCPTAEAAT